MDIWLSLLIHKGTYLVYWEVLSKMTRIWSGQEENSVHTRRMRSQCIAIVGDSSYCKRDGSEREFSADKKDIRI